MEHQAEVSESPPYLSQYECAPECFIGLSIEGSTDLDIVLFEWL